MRNIFFALAPAAAVACLLVCAEARGQHNKKVPPCTDQPTADEVTACYVNRAFLKVLGRAPTPAELEKWKKAPLKGPADQAKYDGMLLDWVVLPQQANERLAVVDRAYAKSSTPDPATILQRNHWANAIRDQRLTFYQVAHEVTPDLSISELKGIPNDPTAISVRVANLNPWASSKEGKLVWARLQDQCGWYPFGNTVFPLPSIPPGKDVWVPVKVAYKLHGTIHVGYELFVMHAEDRDYENNRKCVRASLGTKETPEGPPLKIPPGGKPKGVRP